MTSSDVGAAWSAAKDAARLGPRFGTVQTIAAQAPSDYAYASDTAYQRAGSPFWAFNNAWAPPPANTQRVEYDPDNFPNRTTLAWANAGAGHDVLGYPEIVIGTQGPNDDSSAGGPIYGPNGKPGLPAWSGTPLGELSHIIFDWDITINSATDPTGFDCLCETWLGAPGAQSRNETGLVLKDPGWWSSKTAHPFSNLGGMSGYLIPNGWAKGSLTIIPASVYKTNVLLPSGTVDLWPILSYAASQGWTSMDYPLKGWKFGIEYTNGSGSVTWNDLGFTVS